MHRIAFVVCPGFEMLELAGPAAVFDVANHLLIEAGGAAFYVIEVVSALGGTVSSHAGLALTTGSLQQLAPTEIDTMLIVGTPPDSMFPGLEDPVLGDWARQCAESRSRIASVCTGAFLLAYAGLLDGRRVATHWGACRLLAERHPSVLVDPDTLFLVDGPIWSSAGVTAGIDMALAMVSDDVGADIASQVAKMLVLYARRPGHQSQFSPLLLAQAKTDEPFAELIDWLQANLSADINIPALAGRAGMGERSFHRKFVAATGETPARFVESLRLDAARMLLGQDLSLKVIAAEVGFRSATGLVKAFERRFGITPTLFREMHVNPKLREAAQSSFSE